MNFWLLKIVSIKKVQMEWINVNITAQKISNLPIMTCASNQHHILTQKKTAKQISKTGVVFVSQDVQDFGKIWVLIVKNLKLKR